MIHFSFFNLVNFIKEFLKKSDCFICFNRLKTFIDVFLDGEPNGVVFAEKINEQTRKK